MGVFRGNETACAAALRMRFHYLIRGQLRCACGFITAKYAHVHIPSAVPVPFLLPLFKFLRMRGKGLGPRLGRLSFFTRPFLLSQHKHTDTKTCQFQRLRSAAVREFKREDAVRASVKRKRITGVYAVAHRIISAISNDDVATAFLAENKHLTCWLFVLVLGVYVFPCMSLSLSYTHHLTMQ